MFIKESFLSVAVQGVKTDFSEYLTTLEKLQRAYNECTENDEPSLILK